MFPCAYRRCSPKEQTEEYGSIYQLIRKPPESYVAKTLSTNVKGIKKGIFHS